MVPVPTNAECREYFEHFTVHYNPTNLLLSKEVRVLLDRCLPTHFHSWVTVRFRKNGSLKKWGENSKWDALPLAIYSGRNGISNKWGEFSRILAKTRKFRFKTSLKIIAIYSGRNGISNKWGATIRNSLL